MGLTNKAKEEWGGMSHGGITCFGVVFLEKSRFEKHTESCWSVTIYIIDLLCSLKKQRQRQAVILYSASQTTVHNCDTNLQCVKSHLND